MPRLQPGCATAALLPERMPAGRILCLALVAAVAVTCWALPPSLAPAEEPQTTDELRESLEERQEQAQQAEDQLVRLTAQERKLHEDLAAAEDRLRKLEDSVAEQEKALEQVQREEQRVQNQYADLILEKKLALADLERLLEALWPAHVENKANRGRKLPAWDRADRRFVWLSTVYSATREKLAQVREKQLRIQASLTRQQELASQIRTRLAAVNRDKGALLSGRIAFRKKLSALRQEIVSREEEMNQLMEAISNLNYQLERNLSGADVEFSRRKGLLPWPAGGPVVKDYAPNSSPPVRGLGLALNDGDQVQAVSWGKVVHNDLLRGFGRVIILLHGEDYYSLYAYLSQSSVELGQEVESGQPLGVAGYYPGAGQTGLYFELRFHQKAINPKGWLAPRG